MAEETTTPTLDPFVESIVKSMDKVLDPTTPVEPEPSIESEGLTLGEAALLAKAGVTSLAPASPAAPAAPATPAAPAAPVTPAPAAPAQPKLTIKRREPEAPITQPPPQPPTPPAPQPSADEVKKRQEEEEYIKSLTPQQAYMIQVAETAERTGIKAGFRAKTLDYFKQLDKFIEDHPDTPVEHEDFQAFIKANEPSLSDEEIRKVERRMVIDEAKGEILKDVQPTIQAQEREIRELRTKPVIESTIQQVETLLTSQSDRAPNETEDAHKQRVANEPAPFEKEVVEAINRLGYDKAKEQYPTQAPIIQGTLNAIETWHKISNRLELVNEQDPTHAFLINFIAEQGNNIKAMPKEARMLGGKDFLPMHEFIEQTRKDPSASNRFYTLTDSMISEMLVSNAKIVLKNRYSEIERSGFKREVKKVSAAPGNGTAPPTPATPPQPEGGPASPRAGTAPMPGTNDGPGKASELGTHFPELQRLLA